MSAVLQEDARTNHSSIKRLLKYSDGTSIINRNLIFACFVHIYTDLLKYVCRKTGHLGEGAAGVVS